MVEVRDVVALTAGRGCELLADGAVRCDPGPFGVYVHVAVDAGDGDDDVDGHAVRQFFSAHGGAGSDRIHGPASAVTYRPGRAAASASSSATRQTADRCRCATGPSGR